MMLKPVQQADDNAAQVVNRASVIMQVVIIAIAQNHSGFLQLAVIRCRDFVDNCLLGSILGESTSESRGFAIPRLDRHLQYGYNLLYRFKSVRTLIGHSSGFRLESED